MNEFTKAIKLQQEDRLTCADSKAQLAEYVAAELMGDTDLIDASALTLHLEVCPNCATEYQDLLDLTTSAYVETLPQPAQIPQFDFSFIEAKSKRTFWWNELGRLVIELSTELLNTAQSPAAPAYSGLKSGSSSQLLCELNISDADDDLQVNIIAEETRHDSSTWYVVADVDIPSRGGWPNLAGTQVTLRHEDQPIASHETDAFGKVVFENIPVDNLPHLAFEVMIEGREA